MNTENRFRAIGVLTLAAVLSYAVMGVPTGKVAKEVPSTGDRTEVVVGAAS